MSVPEDRVESPEQLSPQAVAFLREAGTEGAGGFTYWPFARAKVQWLRDVVQELTVPGFVELRDADHARITPAGRQALYREMVRRYEPELEERRTQREAQR